jgi:hypothetical protein
VIDGAAVADLAALDAPVIPDADLLSCISNKDQVLPLVETKNKATLLLSKSNPAQKLAGCATRIQAWARKCLGVAAFELFRTRSRAATRIQVHARRRIALLRVRAMLAERREYQTEKWAGLQTKLKQNWRRFEDPDAPKYILHVPSLTIEEYLRLGLSSFPVRQNLQLTRLVECAGPNVEVIYVAPFPLDDEILDYYKKILSIGGVADPHSKFTVVVPENIDRFPRHFPLASVLLYSPHALGRVRQCARGKPGYMVGGCGGYQEKKVALELGVPLLAPEADVGAWAGTRSGGKRAFMESDVSVVVGAHDIYDEEDFVIALTKLIASNLDVERWMFRVDVDYGNVGSGYFDVRAKSTKNPSAPPPRTLTPLLHPQVDELKVMADLRKERAQLYSIHKGDVSVWLHPDVQLLARAKILRELRAVLYQKGVCCGRDMFYSLKEFLRVFMRMGGVIEAEPIGIVGRPSMNLLITPLGEVKMLSAVDLLMDDEGALIGSSYPMQSVPPRALQGAAAAVGANLAKHDFIGYCSVNFVAYRVEAERPAEDGAASQTQTQTTGKPKVRRELRMCGVSIDPYLTNASAMHGFVKFVCGQPENEVLARSYASCDAVHNPGLCSVQYGSFFKLCRMQAVSFDLESLSGLMFLLYDSLSAGMLGMVAVGDNKFNSLERLAGGFGFIKGNVGSASSYNEVNLDDPGAGGEGFMAGFVRVMKAVETETRRVGVLFKADARKRMMKAARSTGGAPAEALT